MWIRLRTSINVRLQGLFVILVNLGRTNEIISYKFWTIAWSSLHSVSRVLLSLKRSVKMLFNIWLEQCTWWDCNNSKFKMRFWNCFYFLSLSETYRTLFLYRPEQCNTDRYNTIPTGIKRNFYFWNTGRYRHWSVPESGNFQQSRYWSVPVYPNWRSVQYRYMKLWYCCRYELT